MCVAAAALFLCTPVAVYDGDGPIHCREGQKIRVAGIAARRWMEPVGEDTHALAPAPSLRVTRLSASLVERGGA
jgi:hypothetical protein